MIDAETEFIKRRKAEKLRRAEKENIVFLSFPPPLRSPPFIEFFSKWFMRNLDSVLLRHLGQGGFQAGFGIHQEVGADHDVFASLQA